MLRSTVALIFLTSLCSLALAQKRVALVVGNSGYLHAGSLANPKNDAGDVAVVLRNLGLQVVEGHDLDKAAFDRKVREFDVALTGADVGLFFFAGHGMQVEGHNYLIPTDAELKTISALDFEMVRVDAIQRVMERHASTNILFLDACRNNPLARNLARAMGTRSTVIGRGLAATEGGVGTLISFSTQPGNVALDGTGRNSPFAAALVKHITNSNYDLGAILINVRNDVIKVTERRQVPWEHSALTGMFYFNPSSPQLVMPRQAPRSELFTDEQMKRVIAISQTKGFSLPKFQIRKPEPQVSEGLRRFVGVWAGSWTSGRGYMLIVENVSPSGQAVGYTVIGPQVKGSLSTPAKHYPFVGVIKNNKLSLFGPNTESGFQFSDSNRLRATEKWTNGISSKGVLEPIWTLAAAERSAK